ncbi:MAG: bifunctional nuclease family protein [Kiritimatiellae bacterium]|nr:bifunctional nuclease family protein [Kiritimatiellia bacterium]MDW8458842.1 bifunctional nuclease family protein [Verrucomicrobiota bacterium]
MAEEIAVQIRGLLSVPDGVGVLLTNSEKTIAIFVDEYVGGAIAMALNKKKTPRPLTHELIGNIFAGLGVRVQKVVVNDLKDDTFFARLFLLQENELGKSLVEIDARPSDSIALAVQHGSPIYVARHVWEAARDMSWAVEQIESKEDKNEDDASPDT